MKENKCCQLCKRIFHQTVNPKEGDPTIEDCGNTHCLCHHSTLERGDLLTEIEKKVEGMIMKNKIPDYGPDHLPMTQTDLVKMGLYERDNGWNAALTDLLSYLHTLRDNKK